MRSLDERAARRREDERPITEAPQPLARPDPGRLTPAGVAQLQQSCGNAALARVLSTPAPPTSRTETFAYEFQATIRRGPEPRAPAGGPAAAVSGDAYSGHAKTIERAEIEPFIQDVPEEAAPPEVAAAPESGAAAAAPAATAAPEAGPAAQPIRLPDIEFPELAELRATDSVLSALAYAGSVSRGGITLEATEFGSCHWGDVKVKDIVVTPVRSVFVVTAKLEHTIRWDVRSGTGPNAEVNISSAASSAITNSNWTDVADALTPDMSDDNGRPPRTGFWAQDLTERHEKFHADDVKSFGPAAVLTAMAWLNGRTATSTAGVNTLLTRVPGRVVDALIATYAPDDEPRAYGDGAPWYTARSDLIRSKGRKGDYP